MECKKKEEETTTGRVTRDTGLFLGGALIGIFINALFQFMLKQTTGAAMTCGLGVIQIGINAYVLLVVSQYIEKPGFLTMGMLSSQEMLIKRCYV